MTSGQPESWIARTGQRAKAIVTLAVACFSPAAAVFAFSFGATYVAVGLLVLAVAIAAMCLGLWSTLSKVT